MGRGKELEGAIQTNSALCYKLAVDEAVGAYQNRTGQIKLLGPSSSRLQADDDNEKKKDVSQGG